MWRNTHLGMTNPAILARPIRPPNVSQAYITCTNLKPMGTVAGLLGTGICIIRDFTYMCTYVYVHVHVHVHVYMYMYMYMHMYVYMYMCMYMYTYTYVYICVCLYVYIYIYRYIYSIYRIKAGGSPELPGTLSLVMCYKSHGIEMGGGGVWGCNNVMWTIVGLRLVETLRVLLR